MLVKNAQNLIQAVIKTVQAAEAACMKVRHKGKPVHHVYQLQSNTCKSTM